MIHSAPPYQAQQVTYVQQPPPGVVYAVGSGTPRIQPAPYVLPNKRSHFVLGLIQMILGSFVAVMSVAGILYGSVTLVLGTGIYTGAFFFVTGFLGLRASQMTTPSARCLLIACLVMCILCSFVSLVGILTASIEHGSIQAYIMYQRSGDQPVDGRTSFQLIKCSVVIGCCIFEFIISIVHAGFGCASCCSCCHPSSAPSNVPPPAMAQNQVVTTYATQQPPGQAAAYHPMVQQPPAYPAPMSGPPAAAPMYQPPPTMPPPNYSQPPPYSYPMVQAGAPQQPPQPLQQPSFPPASQAGAEAAQHSPPPAMPSAPPAWEAGPLPPKA